MWIHEIKKTKQCCRNFQSIFSTRNKPFCVLTDCPVVLSPPTVRVGEVSAMMIPVLWRGSLTVRASLISVHFRSDSKWLSVQRNGTPTILYFFLSKIISTDSYEKFTVNGYLLHVFWSNIYHNDQNFVNDENKILNAANILIFENYYYYWNFTEDAKNEKHEYNIFRTFFISSNKIR